MSAMEAKPDEVQFVVGEDWSFGPSRKLIAIPVINGDISKQVIESETVGELARKCAQELHSCLIVCEEAPLLEPDHLAEAGDERAKYVVKSKIKDIYDSLAVDLAACSNQ